MVSSINWILASGNEDKRMREITRPFLRLLVITCALLSGCSTLKYGDNLRLVRPGMSQDQVIQLIGFPVSSDNIFNDYTMSRFEHHENYILYSPSFGPVFVVYEKDKVFAVYQNELEYGRWYAETFWNIFKDTKTDSNMRSKMLADFVNVNMWEQRNNNYHWDLFWKLYQDDQTPERTRDVMKLKYEQFEADKRLFVGLVGANKMLSTHRALQQLDNKPPVNCATTDSGLGTTHTTCK